MHPEMTAKSDPSLDLSELCFLTRHARVRMQQRRIGSDLLAAALDYGREIWTNTDVVIVIGRREVARYAREGVDLTPVEGLLVVCSHEGDVITVYRTRNVRKFLLRRERSRGRARRNERR